MTLRVSFFGGSAPAPLSFYFIQCGLRPQTPTYFSLVRKVGKSTHREGTLSMGSLPYEPHPRDDTKGAKPPLESPA